MLTRQMEALILRLSDDVRGTHVIRYIGEYRFFWFLSVLLLRDLCNFHHFLFLRLLTLNDKLYLLRCRSIPYRLYGARLVSAQHDLSGRNEGLGRHLRLHGPEESPWASEKRFVDIVICVEAVVRVDDGALVDLLYLF